MKLQSQISRKYKDQEYKKYWIVLSSKLIDKLGWKEGQELEADVKNEKLVIEKD